MKPWPYPRWIAHRGAGTLAPENTLAAFRLGASHGFRMFECDAKLSADGVPFLLHDPTLQRTTNGAGTAGDLSWQTLSQLDAGKLVPGYTGERLPTLEAVASFCLENDYLLNIEIKPTPGIERHTGEVVAQHAARLWRDAPVPPLLSSFEVEALEGAAAVAPQLPRGLLLRKLPADWLEVAVRLGCVAVICHHKLWNPDTVAQAKAAGMRTLSYTVNKSRDADELIAWGTDGIITDRVDLFSPA